MGPSSGINRWAAADATPLETVPWLPEPLAVRSRCAEERCWSLAHDPAGRVKPYVCASPALPPAPTPTPIPIAFARLGSLLRFGLFNPTHLCPLVLRARRCTWGPSTARRPSTSGSTRTANPCLRPSRSRYGHPALAPPHAPSSCPSSSKDLKAPSSTAAPSPLGRFASSPNPQLAPRLPVVTLAPSPA